MHIPRGSRGAPVTSLPQKGPKREASDALIQKGKAFLDAGLFDRAADTFQEAVNVDPSIGAGFYYLAFVKYRTGEYGAVWDFLEKAEALLGNDPAWKNQLEELKMEAQQVKP